MITLKQGRRSRPATDNELAPEDRLIIAVFRQARMDLFSASRRVQFEAERFLGAYGYDVEQIKASWQAKT